jgi:HK97 family phage major capsid protein
MRELKILLERRDEAKLAAKATYDRVKAEGRDFTDVESQHFWTNARECDDLSREIALAQMERNEITRGRTMSNPPTLTLPTDGRLPGDERPAQPMVRTTKLKAFKNERDAHDAGMWFRAVVSRTHHGQLDARAEEHCRKRGLEITTASYEGSGPSGGYLVPAPIAQTIIDVREDVGVARRVTNVIPATADTLTIPKRAGGLTVYYGSENPSADMTDSDKTWDQVELIMKKRYVVSKISQELVDDALISIVDNLIQEMAYALALQEDNEFINGNGTSTYGLVRGVLNLLGAGGTYTAETGDSTWATLDLNDFVATMGKLPSRFNRNPVWICSSEFYHSSMLNILSGAAGNSIELLQSGDRGRRSFMGYPVFLTSWMPTATAVSQVCALFGDFRMGTILADRTGVRVARDDSIGFLRDMVTLKAVTRYDIRVHEPGDASSAGSYVGLKTAAS